jgi:hypothetical protein
LNDDDLLLSTFVHEQMHRFLALSRQEDFDQAKTDLRRLFPEIPVGFPQESSIDEGNYEAIDDRGSFWSGKRGSNSRPQPWQGCALPTELFPP